MSTAPPTIPAMRQSAISQCFACALRRDDSELLGDALPGLLDGGGVANDGGGHLEAFGGGCRRWRHESSRTYSRVGTVVVQRNESKYVKIVSILCSGKSTELARKFWEWDKIKKGQQKDWNSNGTTKKSSSRRMWSGSLVSDKAQETKEVGE